MKTSRREGLGFELGLFVAAVAIAETVAARWVHRGFVVSAGDNVWFFNFANFVSKHAIAWNFGQSVLGKFTSGAEMLPWVLFLSGLSYAFGQSNAQMLACGFFLALTWYSALVLLRSLSFGTGVACVVATIYAFNPWIQAVFGTNFPIMWCLPTLPAMTACYFYAARRPEKRKACLIVLCAISSIAVSVIAANPGLLLIVIFACLTAGILAQATCEDGALYRKWFLVSSVYIVLCSLWWIVPVFSEYVFSTPGAASGAGGYSFVVARSSLLNNLRLLPFWSWAFPQYYPYAKSYDENVFLYASGFTLIALSMLGVAWSRPSRQFISRVCAAIILAGLFISKGIHPPFAWANEILYRIPGMILLREPTSKAPLIVLVFATIGAACFLEYVASDLAVRKRRALSIAGGIVLCFVAIASGKAIVTGEIFRGATLGLPSSYIQIPDYWPAAARYVNAKADEGALLVLPADPYYQVEYNWGYYGADYLPLDLIRRPVQVVGDLTYTTGGHLDVLAGVVTQISKRSPLAAAELRQLGIRYVIYRGDVQQLGLRMKPADVEGALGVKPAKSFGPLVLFDLGDSRSRITVSKNWIAGQYDGLGVETVGGVKALLGGAPRVWLGSAKVLSSAGDLPKPQAYERVFRRPLVQDPMLASLLSSVPSRLIWNAAEDQPKLHAWREVAQNNGRSLLGLLGDDGLGETELVTLPVTLLRPNRREGLEWKPMLTAQSLDATGDDYASVTVMNPSMRTVSADFSMAVLVKRNTAFILQANGVIRQSRSSANPHAQWLTFRNVQLEPGRNEISILRHTSEDLNAPANTEPVKLANNIGQLEIRFKGYLTSAKGLDSEYPDFVSLSPELPHAFVASLPLRIAGSYWPSIAVQVKGRPPVQLGTVLNFTLRGLKRSCYTAVVPDVPSNLVPSIAACLRADGISLSYADLGQLKIDEMKIDAALYDQNRPYVGDTSIAKVIVSIVPHDANYATFSPVNISPNNFDGRIIHGQGDEYHVGVVKAPTLRSYLDTPVRIYLGRRVMEGRIAAVEHGFISFIDMTNNRSWIAASEVTRIVPTSPHAIGLNVQWPVARGQAVDVLKISGPELSSVTLETRYSRGITKRIPLSPSDLYARPGAEPLFTLCGSCTASASPAMEATLQLRFTPSNDSQRSVDVRGRRIYGLSVAPPEQLPQVIRSQTALNLIRPIKAAIFPGTSGVVGASAGFNRDDGSVVQSAALQGLPVAITVKRQFVSLNETYSPTWMAICLGHCPVFPPHLYVDWGTNGWWIAGEGRVLLFNVIVLAQLFASATSIFALLSLAGGTVARYARRPQRATSV